MKNLKNLLAAITLFGVLIFGTFSANANVAAEATTVTTPESEFIQPDGETEEVLIEFWGIIITQKGGIIITQKTGIIITQ